MSNLKSYEHDAHHTRCDRDWLELLWNAFNERDEVTFKLAIADLLDSKDYLNEEIIRYRTFLNSITWNTSRSKDSKLAVGQLAKELTDMHFRLQEVLDLRNIGSTREKASTNGKKKS